MDIEVGDLFPKADVLNRKRLLEDVVALRSSASTNGDMVAGDEAVMIFSLKT